MESLKYVLLIGVCFGGLNAGTAEAELVYPGRTWQIKRPDEVGLDELKLKQMSDYAGGFGCVVKGGCMVYTWGDPSRSKDVASAVKPLYTHFLIKAIESGKLKGFDDRVSRFEPRLKSLSEARGHKDSEITWRHLCNQTSCYGVAERPGQAYDYSDWNMALFFDSLFLKVYGTTWDKVDSQVFRPGLTDLLQCEDKPTFMAFGTGNRPGRLAISPRDFARFGLLYLRKGKWKANQLITADHAKMVVSSPLPISIPRTKGEKGEMIKSQRSIGGGNNQCDHNGNYSFAWWLNGIGRDGTRNWPDVSDDVYGCFGHGDIRAMVVMPSLDLIVCWNDTKIEGSKKVNHALNLLEDSVIQSKSGGGIVADPENRRWLKRHDGRGFFLCGPGDPEDFLYRGKLRPDGTRDGDQAALIAKTKGSGANCIYLMAVRSHGGDGDKTHNPFIDHDPSKGINHKVLDQWEQWFARMDSGGIVIYFFLYDDSTRVWKTGDNVGEQEGKFIRTIVNKFEHHKNLIWCVAEEYQEALSVKRVKNIAAQIRSADDRSHAIAVHKLNGLSFKEFADDENIDQFAIQYNENTPDALHQGMVKAWKDANGRYNLNMSEAKGFGSGKALRDRSWACAMGGAYIMILEMDIANTPKSDLEDCGRLVRFFETTNFNQMAPHDELAMAGTKYVLAKPGNSYIAYSPNLNGKIGLKDFKPGMYDFRWFDCATGKEVVQKAVKAGAGNQAWSRPNAIGKELAVHIRRAGK